MSIRGEQWTQEAVQRFSEERKLQQERAKTSGLPRQPEAVVEDTEGKRVVLLHGGTVRTDLRKEGDPQAAKYIPRFRREGEQVGQAGQTVYYEAMGRGREATGRR